MRWGYFGLWGADRFNENALFFNWFVIVCERESLMLLWFGFRQAVVFCYNPSDICLRCNKSFCLCRWFTGWRWIARLWKQHQSSASTGDDANYFWQIRLSKTLNVNSSTTHRLLLCPRLTANLSKLRKDCELSRADTRSCWTLRKIEDKSFSTQGVASQACDVAVPLFRVIPGRFMLMLNKLVWRSQSDASSSLSTFRGFDPKISFYRRYGDIAMVIRMQ